MESEAHIEYIFIDESGDLGRYGTAYFTIASLATHDTIALARIIKKLRQRKLKKKMRELTEIKANNSTDYIRRYVLGKIANIDCSISAVAIPKSKIGPGLFDHKEKLYNYLCGLLFEHISINADIIDITIDKKHRNRLLREDFNGYLERKISERRNGIRILIRHLESHASNGLQAIDFVAWAINRKFSSHDSTYYDLIRNKIRNAGKEVVWE